MRRLSWIITVPITLAAIFFAIANREPATLSLWPGPWAVALPTYVLVLGCLLLGFLVGTVVAWLSAGERRRRYRRLSERVQSQATQLSELRNELAAALARPAPPPAPASPPSGTLPVLRG